MQGKIAFIGLGKMGLPMALNLLKAGFALRVFDLQAQALQQAALAGAEVAGSVRALISDDVQVVISMLPSGAQVEEVYLGESGLLSILPADCLLLDCSTIAPATARKLAQAVQDEGRGLVFVDAPVSGGTGGAQAATLSFMLGGAAQAVERARPVLQAMGKNIFHAGPHGAGQSAKVCNNMLLGILMAGTAEALALGVAQGVQPEVLSAIMQQSSGRNWALEIYNPWPGVHAHAPAARDFEGGFAVDLMHKDLSLAADAALASQSVIPLGELARNLFRLHAQQGAGSKDFSSIVQMFAPQLR